MAVGVRSAYADDEHLDGEEFRVTETDNERATLANDQTSAFSFGRNERVGLSFRETDRDVFVKNVRCGNRREIASV